MTFRIWRLYMAACTRIRGRGTGIYQIVASKRDGGSFGPCP